MFYKLRTGKEYNVGTPPGHESHYITLCREFTKVFKGDTKRLVLNIPPRYGKTELCIHFIAWSLARYPDSNFLYVSYAKELATEQTEIIRQIVSMPEYKQLFDVHIAKDSNAKDRFRTTAGGKVFAAGSAGVVTGRGAGIPDVDRFAGAIVIDDIIKPDDAPSDTIRERCNNWYFNTLASRVNDPHKTPIIYIGQRVHEDDLAANLLNSYDGIEWSSTILPVVDASGNPLDPTKHTIDDIRRMEETSQYVFAAQYMQNPTPAGGSIFKPDWFVRMNQDPKIIATFITADTAETSKTYNDATVFSFWGLYRIEQMGVETDLYGLHWLDCQECWVEPKDLKDEFMAFYAACMRHEVKPKMVAIEKKSTGTTLVSVLKEVQGLHVLDIERSCASGSKAQRFLECQPYVAAGQVSLNVFSKHTGDVIDHMRKITANDSHRYDDIADTMADAIKLALIDKLIHNLHTKDEPATKTMNTIASHNAKLRRAHIGSNRWR